MSKKNKIRRKISKPGASSSVVTSTSPSKSRLVEKRFPFISIIAKPHIGFIILSLLFGTLFLVTTPPFQVADEISHFKRAFKLSEFATIQKIKNNQSGDYVPVSIDSTAAIFNYLMFHPDQKVDKQKILDAFKTRLQPKKEQFAGIAAGPYFYVSYIPQFPAILVGRLFGLSVLVMLYLGRFFALLFYTICVSYAIKKIPVGKFLLMTIALMPMCLAQAGSYNADCVLFSLSFLAAAILIKLSFDQHDLKINRETILLFLILAIIGVLKIVYLPIALFIFILPAAVFRNNVRYAVIGTSLILISAALAIAWLKINSISTTPPNPDFDTPGKIRLLIHNPFVSLKIVSQSIDRFSETYYRSTIGILGYVDTTLNDGVYKTFTFLILLLALFEGSRNSKLLLHQRIIFLVIPVIVFTGAYVALYLINPKENGFIATGVQGRYFIPVLFPFFLAFQGLIPFGTNLSNYKVFVFVLYIILFVALINTEMTIVERYYW
jgi:uncharacterized membrane protein